MCLIQAIFNRSLSRASLPALVVLTGGRSKGHREINRIGSFVTGTKVHLGLVTGSKSFHCWSLLFATFWENVLVPKKCFSAPIQGTQTETQRWQLRPLQATPKPLAGMWLLRWKVCSKTCCGSHVPMGPGGLELASYPNICSALRCSDTGTLCRYFSVILPVPVIFNKCSKSLHQITATQIHQSGILCWLLCRYSWWTIHSSYLEYVSKPW